MKRLRLSILCAAAVLAVGVTTYLVAANSQHDHKGHGATKKADSGPLANATVSFGAWKTSPPVDRFPNRSDTRNDNVHVIIPEVAKIKAGGTVNFIIAGFHQVIVYDDGTRPEDIDTSITVLPTTTPPSPPPPLIADPNRRVYRGPDPSLLPADRVEVVHFAEPGTYLVICGVLPHFQAGMFGYVRVLGPGERD
jgi:plastocyanin